jgi:hypothetical protein
MNGLRRSTFGVTLGIGLLAGLGAVTDASAGAVAYDETGTYKSANVGADQYAVGDIVIGSYGYGFIKSP